MEGLTVGEKILAIFIAVVFLCAILFLEFYLGYLINDKFGLGATIVYCTILLTLNGIPQGISKKR